MAELLKHKNTDVNQELFSNMFNIYELSTFECVYLFSSIDYEDKLLDDILKKDLVNKNKIVFIASNPDGYEKSDKYSKELIEYFKKFKLNEFTLIDKRTTKYACIKHIESADVIFLMGGNPLTQLDFIKEYEIDALLSRFKGIIMGMSAGAINLGVNSYCSKDEDIPDTLIYNGLGLVDLTIDPHFDINNESQKEEFLKQTINIIGLPDNSFIKVSKYGEQSFYGEYYIKENNIIVKGQ